MVGGAGPASASRCSAAMPPGGHANVTEDDVRLQSAGHGLRRLAAGRLADHLQIVAQSEQTADPAADQLLIID